MTPVTLPLRAALTAGNATLTVLNTRTQGRMTYKVRQCDDTPDLYFVKVLTGPNNEEDYQYLGTIRGAQYAHGRKSRIGEDAPSARGFMWLWDHADALPAHVEVYHEGRCLRCGRTLTTPESVIRSIGPDCWEQMGMDA